MCSILIIGTGGGVCGVWGTASEYAMVGCVGWSVWWWCVLVWRYTVP